MTILPTTACNIVRNKSIACMARKSQSGKHFEAYTLYITAFLLFIILCILSFICAVSALQTQSNTWHHLVQLNDYRNTSIWRKSKLKTNRQIQQPTENNIHSHQMDLAHKRNCLNVFNKNRSEHWELSHELERQSKFYQNWASLQC